jgi:hypothetical protein
VINRSPAKIPRWHHVIVIPEDNKIIVFHKGSPQGSKVLMPIGGQIQPIPIDGDKLQWKNAQKKLKKNINSEAMNKHIPNRIPSWTLNVWWPSNVASIMMSENQRKR